MDKQVKPGSTTAYATPLPNVPRPGAGRKTRPNRTKPPKLVQPTVELGDAVEAALRTVGITKERVSKWMGRPCRCDERQEKLNQLSRWAKRILMGQTEDADKLLTEIIGGPDET